MPNHLPIWAHISYQLAFETWRCFFFGHSLPAVCRETQMTYLKVLGSNQSVIGWGHLFSPRSKKKGEVFCGCISQGKRLLDWDNSISFTHASHVSIQTLVSGAHLVLIGTVLHLMPFLALYMCVLVRRGVTFIPQLTPNSEVNAMFLLDSWLSSSPPSWCFLACLEISVTGNS